jgi:hypothetical protein
VALTLFVGLAAAAAKQPKTFKVKSTLDGKTVLPQRIHWLAFPRLPSSQVRQVEFLIDGKVRWVESRAPYSYSDDGGYLVTSWLSPGRHRFTVRATSWTGRRGIATVVARVIPAPSPDASLAGSWQREVATPVAPDPNYPGDAVPAGTWTLTFDQRWIASQFPGTFDPKTSPQTAAGNVLLDDYTPESNTLTLYGAVTTGPFNPRVAAGGGWWCGPGGPKATYTWSVSDTTLTLKPIVADACSQRGGIYAGQWTRVS